MSMKSKTVLVFLFGTLFVVGVAAVLCFVRALSPAYTAVIVLLTYCLLFVLLGGLLRVESETKRRESKRLQDALESDRAKTDFINIAIHQLKTPLTALKWSVEMLGNIKSKAEWTDDEDEAFGQVVSATRHLDALVASLLNVGRIESGRLKIEPRPTDLKDLAADVVDELLGSADRKEQKITVEVAAGIPKLDVDADLIREVYKNLLTNAIKFSPPKGMIELKVRVVGQDVVSSVKDNGIGVPKDEQARIFDRFYRASNVENEAEDGSGLGLYFAKQIVELSGGKIWVESVAGAGATFYFSLPLSGSKSKVG